MFKELKERFDKLSELCDKGIELELKESQGENINDESEELLVRIALEFVKIQNIAEM